MWLRCLREGSPLVLLMGNLYLLADRKARRWGRSGMQRLEDSRDTPGGGARREKLENTRGGSLLFPRTLSSQVLNPPKNLQNREISTPCSPHLFVCLYACIPPNIHSLDKFLLHIFSFLDTGDTVFKRQI